MENSYFCRVLNSTNMKRFLQWIWVVVFVGGQMEEYNLFDTPKLVLDIVGTNGEEKRIELEAKEMW